MAVNNLIENARQQLWKICTMLASNTMKMELPHQWCGVRCKSHSQVLNPVRQKHTDDLFKFVLKKITLFLAIAKTKDNVTAISNVLCIYSMQIFNVICQATDLQHHEVLF